MKETPMPPASEANLVANSGYMYIIYGVSVNYSFDLMNIYQRYDSYPIQQYKYYSCSQKLNRTHIRTLFINGIRGSRVNSLVQERRNSKLVILHKNCLQKLP